MAMDKVKFANKKYKHERKRRLKARAEKKRLLFEDQERSSRRIKTNIYDIEEA